MKIIIIINNNPWVKNTASANRWLSLIEGLEYQNYVIKLFFYEGYTSFQEKSIWGSSGIYRNISYEYLENNVVGGYFQIRWNNYVRKYSRFKKILNLIINKLQKDYDIIWTDTTHLGFKLTFYLKKYFPDKIFFTEISEFMDIQRYNKGNLLQHIAALQRKKYFEKKAFYAFDGIVLMTNTLLNFFEKFPPPHPRFLHLPMTVDFSRFKNPDLNFDEFKKPYIAFVGVMNDAKDGVSILINAFHLISGKYPSHNLYLIGPWNYDTPFHLKLIKKKGLSNRVFWMKEYPRENIPLILSNADLLVLPRPDSKQARGGFPTKLGEYLATGCPVCATSVGEIPNYLVNDESIFFAEPGSIESFAETMNRALQNPYLAKIVGANGRKVAETIFNKDIQVEKLNNFLKYLVGINKDLFK
jgi:glycosyltransferase involved in cell wall biosynthesis